MVGTYDVKEGRTMIKIDGFLMCWADRLNGKSNRRSRLEWWGGIRYFPKAGGVIFGAANWCSFHMGVSKNRGTPKFVVYKWKPWKTPLELMIWGYPYIWKHLYAPQKMGGLWWLPMFVWFDFDHNHHWNNHNHNQMSNLVSLLVTKGKTSWCHILVSSTRLWWLEFMLIKYVDIYIYI